ncbi:interferon regulatory factor 3 [Hemibagrus wyckioides]|nr:interferon regulatory factor 3 [Hemibagrus wyckioides]
MAQPKPLFIPWLKQQIDCGQYPGVHWVDQECTQFSIPWKHALRQDSNSDDILIFRAWAQTGSNGQIQGDNSVWKRNFRSALRARGFKMVKDNKNDTANPHKIFSWPDDTQSGCPEPTSCFEASSDDSSACNVELSQDAVLYLEEDELFPDGNMHHDLLQQCLADLNIVETPPEMPSDQAVFVMDPVQLPMNHLSMHHLSPPDRAEASAGQFSPTEGALALCQYSPPEGAFMGTQQPTPQEPQLPVQSTSNDSGSTQFGTHFKVNIYYRGKQVLQQVVENEDGFCVMFRNDPKLMESLLPVVQLPSTESILDQIQAQSTQSILNNLGGLEVRREGGMLLGYRWGDSRAYWGLDKHEQKAIARPLSKNQPEPIFALKEFVLGMMNFIQNRGPSPSYSLYFFLGQQWPDPKNKPWEKKLIMIEVILTALEDLKKMAAVNGASSLQSSMDLQISLEQMMELC